MTGSGHLPLGKKACRPVPTCQQATQNAVPHFGSLLRTFAEVCARGCNSHRYQLAGFKLIYSWARSAPPCCPYSSIAQRDPRSFESIRLEAILRNRLQRAFKLIRRITRRILTSTWPFHIPLKLLSRLTAMVFHPFSHSLSYRQGGWGGTRPVLLLSRGCPTTNARA